MNETDNANAYALFRTRFSDALEQVFLEVPEGPVWTYGDLEAETARLGSALAATGARPGDRVLAQTGKSPRALALYLACLRAGFIYLPLNTAYQRSEIAYFLEDAEPAVCVVDPRSKSLYRELGAPAVLTLGADGEGTLAERAASTSPPGAAGAPVRESSPDDVAVIMYTSGTTGRPKGAMITHGNITSNALALHQAWGWRREDVLLHALPIFHLHGLFVATHLVLLGPSRMIFLPRFDVETVLRELPRATVFMGVPTFYTRLLEDPRFDRELTRNIRLFVSGSAPLLEQTFREFEERTGHRILERYGMTEIGMGTSNPLEGERRPGTVGFPLPGVTVRVADEHDRPVPVGEIGQVQHRGPNVFLGYWRKPEKTAEEFTRDGFFRSGDLGMFDERGYLHIVGRARDLVISGGFNVYPKEVESYLDEIPGVSESAVFGVPHPDFGEAVVAAVVPEPGAPPPEPERLIAALKETLAGFKVPKRIFVLDELPRNAMGKVQKNVLRERYRNTFTTPEAEPASAGHPGGG